MGVHGGGEGSVREVVDRVGFMGVKLIPIVQQWTEETGKASWELHQYHPMPISWGEKDSGTRKHLQ